MKIGIDFGRVIQGGPGAPSGQDTDFLGLPPLQAILCPHNEGALEIICDLASYAHLSGGDVWIISKCGTLVQAKTLAWLFANDFFKRTRINPANIRFCEKREDKAPIAAELGLTHFIDDRVGVLLPMAGIVKHRILYGPQEHATPEGLVHCVNWNAISQIIFTELSEALPRTP